MKTAASRDLYCYWDRLRGTRPAPERVDVDPGAIRKLLGDTFIIEVAGALPYRIAGSRLCALFGHELRGMSFLEPFTLGARDDILRLVDSCIEDAAPVVAGLELVSNQAHRLEAEMLMLPLRHRGERGARLMGAIKPYETPWWVGICPVEQASVASARIVAGAGREVVTSASVHASLPVGRRVRHLTVVDGGRI